MKHLHQCFVAIVLMLSFGHSLSAHDCEVDGIYYNLNNDDMTAEVTYRGSSYNEYDEYSGDIIIPKTVEHNGETYIVTAIGWSAFYNCSSLTNITIPNSVLSIGENALRKCPSLTTIEIPGSVSDIHYTTFWECSALTNYHVNASNEAYCSIDGVLYSKDSQTLVAYPQSLTGNFAIPEHVTTIGKGAFGFCSLSNIAVPNNITTIYEYAFAMSSLKSIDIPNSVVKFWTGWAFYGCKSLTSVAIPKNTDTLFSDAFVGCNSLESLYCFATTPPTSWTFSDIPTTSCTLYVPSESVEAYRAANGWKDFSNIQPLPIYYKFNIIDKTAEVTYRGSTYYEYDEYTGNIVIPETVEYNGETFHVTSIGSSAFYNCSTLESVVIPNSVTSIKNDAFRGCIALTQLNIPNSVTEIGSSAFRSCWAMTDISIPNSITEIGREVFMNWYSLENITIPEGVFSIGNYTFRNCSTLTCITIPSSVTKIGNRPFWDCTSLNTVYCYAVTPPEVQLGSFNSAPTIQTSCTLYVPYGCAEAYRAADGWKDFYEIRDKYEYDGIHYIIDYPKKGDVTVTYKGESADEYNDEYCGNVIIPKSITYNNTIYKVTHIGAEAFKGCSSLTGVTIPAYLTTIEENAFSECSSLDTIYVNAFTPPTFDATAFDERQIVETTMYVSTAQFQTYKASKTWGEFANMKQYWYFGAGVSEESRKVLAQDTDNWEYSDRWTNTSAFTDDVLRVNGNPLAETVGLHFTKSGDYTMVQSEDISLRGDAFRLNRSTVYLTIPSLKAGQKIVIYTESANKTEARALICQTSEVTRIEGDDIGSVNGIWMKNVWKVDATIKGSIDVKFQASHSHLHIQSILVTDAEEMVEVIPESDFELTITSAGYATFYSDKAIQLPENVTAYYGKLSDGNEWLDLYEIAGGKVPASTAVVLKAEPGTYGAWYLDETVAKINGNSLFGYTSDVPTSLINSIGFDVYTLAQENGVVGFYKYTGETLHAGKAFLRMDQSAKAPKMRIMGSETDIEYISSENNASKSVVYDLQGRRVNDMSRKGIYVVNGKKVVVR